MRAPKNTYKRFLFNEVASPSLRNAKQVQSAKALLYSNLEASKRLIERISDENRRRVQQRLREMQSDRIDIYRSLNDELAAEAQRPQDGALGANIRLPTSKVPHTGLALSQKLGEQHLSLSVQSRNPLTGKQAKQFLSQLIELNQSATQ